MKSGKIQQIGTPKDIYTKPANKFVACFIGTSNILDGRVDENRGGNAKISIADKIVLSAKLKTDYTGPVKISVRPEEFQINKEKNSATAADGIAARVSLKTFLGDFINYEVVSESGETVEVNQYLKDIEKEFEIDETVSLNIAEHKFNVFDISADGWLLNE